MPSVTIVPNKDDVNLDTVRQLIKFFVDKIALIAMRHSFETNFYNNLIVSRVGECSITKFDPVEKKLEFEFARHSISCGNPRDSVAAELARFVAFANELSDATGFKIEIQAPLYYYD